MYVPETSEGRESGKIGDHAVGRTSWKTMMSELGKGAKMPGQRRKSALLDICPTYVSEQMMMVMFKLDEIGEIYENLKAKVVSYTANKTEQTRGGQTEIL